MDFDDALRAIGEFGRTQKIQQVVLNSVQFFAAMHMICLVFVGKEPTVNCRSNPRIYDDLCDMKPPCQHYEYGAEFTSIVSEWDLVCEKSHYVGFAQSVFMAGVLLGNVSFGTFSDRYGRLRMTLVALALLSVLGTLSSMTWTFNQFVIFRLLVGWAMGGMGLVMFVLQTENFGCATRVLSTCLAQSCFSLGIMLWAALASFIRGWRTLVLVSSLPLSAYLLIYLSIPESPRWLMSQGRVTEAEDILYEMGRKNGKAISRSMINLSENKKDRADPKTPRYGLMDCFKTPVLRMRMFILIFTWFTCSMVYYGLTMNSGNLGSNMYISVALSGVVEIPAYLFSFVFLNRLGRKKSMCGSMLLGGVACLSMLVIAKDDDSVANLRIGMALLGKMGISSAFNIVYIYSSELLPTVLRNTGLGICSMSARIGGIVAPQVIPMGDTFTFLVFGATAFAGGMLDLKLPETLNKALPETVEDVERRVSVSVPAAAEKEDLLKT